jgi:hypothetical protein
VDLITHALAFLLPVALLGPMAALSGKHSRAALVAAFGPAVLCLVLAALALPTSWGDRPAPGSGDMTNAGAMVLDALLFVFVGALGLVLARRVRCSSHVTPAESSHD